MGVQWTFRTRAGPSRSETGGPRKRWMRSFYRFLPFYSIRQSLKFLLSHFDTSTAKLCIKPQGGGGDTMWNFLGYKGRASEV
nr:MAG TPA: hypothetical protein [Bacteriophage sp.]